ncbi:MAG: hypothetical protein IPG66_06970 [Hydrogenophilales bacterium]|nr:hypothetical protein [Hydrogenophilales bacterium]
MTAEAFQHTLAYRNNRRILYGSIALAILMVVIVAASFIWQLRREAEKRTANTTQNLVSSIELALDGLIDTIDLALLASSEEISRNMDKGAMDEAKARRFLARQKAHLPHEVTLKAINDQGEIIYGAVDTSPSSAAVSTYFSQLRDNPNAGMAVGRLIGQTDPEPVWPFFRRINKPDGSFGGMVVAALGSDQIERIFRVFAWTPVAPSGCAMPIWA